MRKAPLEGKGLLSNPEEQRLYLKNYYGSNTVEMVPSALPEEHNLLHVFEMGTGKAIRIAMGRFVQVSFIVNEGRGIHRIQVTKRVVKFIPEEDMLKDSSVKPEEEPEPKGFFRRLFRRFL